MLEFTLSSTKYPGIVLALPKESDPEKVESVLFNAGIAYPVSNDRKVAIEQQFAALEKRVSRHFTLQFRPVGIELSPELGDSEEETAPSENVEQPNVEQPAVEDVVPEPEPFELTAEDQDLIAVEVSKLLGKTIAEATPMLSNTAANEDLHVDLRVAYLDAVIAHGDIQKGLKEEAADLKELLSA